MDKIGKSGEIVVRLFGPLLKTGPLLMKNILKSLARRVLIPIGSTAAAAATDAAIHKKMFWYSTHPSHLASHTTSLIISNKEMENIMKIVKSLEECGLLIRRVS